MMKYFRNVILMICLSFNAYSQSWDSLNGGASHYVQCIYGDTVSDLLYAAGWFDSIGGVAAKRLARWNGSTWDTIGDGLLNASSGRCFTRYNGEIVCANSFFHLYKDHVARWNGTQWDSLGHHFSTGGIIGIKTLNNELYAFGAFDSINHIYYNSIAKWNGTDWIPIMFPFRDLGTTPIINTMQLFNGDLYVGGAFTDGGFTSMNIAKYDGVSWSFVGGGIHGGMDQVGDLEVYQNELYVAGEFKTSSGNFANGIMRWNGSNWLDVGGGLTSTYDATIYDIHVFDNKLYAAGTFDNIGGINANFIASWDGTNWCGMGNDSTANAVEITSTKNELYIRTGYTWDSDTVKFIAKWTGGSFVDECGFVGIPEKSAAPEIKAYPNPGNGKIKLDFNLPSSSPVLLRVFSSLGQVVFEKDMGTRSGQLTEDLDISAQPSGIYFIALITDLGQSGTRFIKQ